MPTATALLEDLYFHLEWADAEIWRAVSGLDEPYDWELQQRLNHLHMVQGAFLATWRREPFDAKAVEALGGPDLMAWARRFYPQAHEVFREADLSRVAELPWTRQASERLGVEPQRTTLRDTLLQVYTHTAHHRGQIMTRLRELGAAPPNVDYIAWIWRGRPPASWPG